MEDQQTSDILKHIGQRVAELRRAQGMTQETFAARMGCSVKYLQRVEAGRQNLSVKSLVKWSNALDVTMVDLFAGLTPQTAE